MKNLLTRGWDNKVSSPASEWWSSIWTQVNKLLKNIDEFLEEKPLQPKRAIQEYACKNGIRTPKMFDSLEEALASGKKFIIRSEHPQEYAGVSGLSESVVYKPKVIAKYLEWKTEEELRGKVITEQELLSSRLNDDSEFHRGWVTWGMIEWSAWRKITDAMLARIWYLPEQEILRVLSLISSYAFVSYAAKTDEDVNDVVSQQSYSFSEYIEWINHTVIKDKDIKGKYYIVSRGYYDEGWEDKSYHDMIIIQDGEVIREWWYFRANKSWTISDDARKIEFRGIFNHNNLIEKYERVRKLPKFDSNHCPIMEFQSSFDGEEYFLQSHRGSDIQIKESFTLDRQLEEWEVELDFFRGTTSPEWIIINAWSFYVSDNKTRNWSFPVCEEEASFDIHHDSIFSQIMARKRKVQLGNYKNFDWEAMCLTSGHASIAEVFKPDMYTPIPEELFNSIPFEKISDITSSMWVPYRIKLRIISDGNRCLVKRITTDEEIDSDYEKYNIPHMERLRRRWEIEISDTLVIKAKG